MKFYTEEGAQALADEKGRAVCAWIPCMGGQPVTGTREHKWVVDPKGKVSDYENNSGRHSITRVFRPQGR
jgi:hypothetical protein